MNFSGMGLQALQEVKEIRAFSAQQFSAKNNLQLDINVMEGMDGTFCIQMVHLTVLCRLTGFKRDGTDLKKEVPLRKSLSADRKWEETEIWVTLENMKGNKFYVK